LPASVGPFAGSAVAGDHYEFRPPVVVSPDLTAPWVLQLQGRAWPVVYPSGQIGYTVRPVVTPSQQAGQRRGFFQAFDAQQAATVRPGIPTVPAWIRGSFRRSSTLRRRSTWIHYHRYEQPLSLSD
jgi:hypothetical protein